MTINLLDGFMAKLTDSVADLDGGEIVVMNLIHHLGTHQSIVWTDEAINEFVTKIEALLDEMEE